MSDHNDWFEGFMKYEMMNESSDTGSGGGGNFIGCVIVVIVSVVLFALTIYALGDIEDIPGFVIAGLWIGICVFVGSVGSMFRK